MTRTEIINRLIVNSKYESYLEIGLAEGTNFNGVKIANKVSVDPVVDQKTNVKPTYIMGSDEFFKQDFGKQIDRLNAHIAELDIDESQKDALMADFLAAKVEFFEAKALLNEAIKAYQLALKSGDEDAIAVAKLAMEAAERYMKELDWYLIALPNFRKCLRISSMALEVIVLQFIFNATG